MEGRESACEGKELVFVTPRTKSYALDGRLLDPTSAITLLLLRTNGVTMDGESSGCVTVDVADPASTVLDSSMFLLA